ncbi:MAG: S46 family peptidase [bacterium]|jgi:hypothetical protein
MWPPYDIPDEVFQDMRGMGLELTRDEVWNEDGTGVANAVVSVGATGSFVSPDGLILTNHHVAYGAVQRISTSEMNYIERGYLARTREEEVPAHGYRAYIFLGSEDVTQRVRSAVDDSMSPLERYNAIERRTKEIVAEAESEDGVYCEVNAFYGGARYMLDTYVRLRDIRVVYIPARAIGEYGGDIDNWMWPRHTADFSFLRAYVGPDGKAADYSEANVPYRPERYLKISKEGAKEGDFGLIVGFPGRTARYLSSYGLAEYEYFLLPQQIRLYEEMIRLLEIESRAYAEVAVRVASRMKGINNWLKKNRGLLEGFKRFGLTENQRALERDMLERSSGALRVQKILEEYKELYAESERYAMKDLLMSMMLGRGSLLSQALTIYKWSLEKEKPDMERDPDYMEREVINLERKLRIFQMGYSEAGDRVLLDMLIGEAMDLPEWQRMKVFDDIVGGRTGGELDTYLGVFLNELYANTTLDDTGERMRMFNLTHDELMAEGDYFIALAAKFHVENEERIEREKVFKGALNALTPEWIEILAAQRHVAPYSDANGTMRINYGAVGGYSPRDAVHYDAFTTLTGMAEKCTGVFPFDCPERLLELARSDYRGRYHNPKLGDVPVNILTTHDSTNGNSGSPLVNGRGEIVGCLFDGNYEALTADFVFRDDITRSIHVDTRYILFVTEEVDHADNVLRELGLK